MTHEIAGHGVDTATIDGDRTKQDASNKKTWDVPGKLEHIERRSEQEC